MKNLLTQPGTKEENRAIINELMKVVNEKPLNLVKWIEKNLTLDFKRSTNEKTLHVTYSRVDGSPDDLKISLSRVF